MKLKEKACFLCFLSKQKKKYFKKKLDPQNEDNNHVKMRFFPYESQPNTFNAAVLL